MDKFKLVLDSSQISQFLECPQKWSNYYEKRLRPLSYQQNESMNAGTYVHALLDRYYRMKFQGASKSDILTVLNAYKPDNDMCECGCSHEFHCTIPGFEIVECRRCKKCMSFRPHEFTLNPLLRGKVKVSMNLYVEHWWNKEDIMPLSEQHVEVGFSECFYEDKENIFILEGRLDLIGKLQGLDCVMDHKSQSKSSQLYGKSIQFKNYLMASKLNTLIINYIRLHDKKDIEKSWQREVVTMNSIEVEAWRRRLTQVYFRIKANVQASQRGSQYERNWNSCSGAWGGAENACWYTQLCEEIDPKVAKNRESTLYKIDEAQWRPW